MYRLITTTKKIRWLILWHKYLQILKIHQRVAGVVSDEGYAWEDKCYRLVKKFA